MVNAITFSGVGDPSVLSFRAIELAEPGQGEVRIRHTAIGLNFIDTYHRSGLYPLPLPSGLGLEGAGVVEKVGEGVSLKVGDHVAYCRGPVGAYSEARNIAANQLVKLPDSVSDEIAAASMLKGLTAWYLLHETHRITEHSHVLVHAAAGGVGLILTQWARMIGAYVIGTVGSEEKAKLAKAHGCDEVILYRSENVPERVKQLVKNGVEVVYDSVGKDTLFASLDSLRPRGHLVSFGNASGAVPPFNLLELSKRGSLTVTRPTLMDYVRDDSTYQRAAGQFFALIAAGKLKVEVQQRFALKDAANAHAALESRTTTGASIIIP